MLSFNSGVVGESQQGDNEITIGRFKGGFLNTKLFGVKIVFLKLYKDL